MQTIDVHVHIIKYVLIIKTSKYNLHKSARKLEYGPDECFGQQTLIKDYT